MRCQPSLFEIEKTAELKGQVKNERPYSLPGILLGTSSFTAAGWQGTFYPEGMRSQEFLRQSPAAYQVDLAVDLK